MANVDANEECKVERIERSGITDGRLYFSVKWVPSTGSNLKSIIVWADEMPNAQEAIAHYCKSVGVANIQQLTSHYLAAEYCLLQAKKAMAKMKEEQALQEKSKGGEIKLRGYKRFHEAMKNANVPSTSSSDATASSSSGASSSSSSGAPFTTNS